MDEKTIELGVITTQPTEEGVSATGHGTGLAGTPGFRKLTEAEVAECVAFLPCRFTSSRAGLTFFSVAVTCSCREILACIQNGPKCACCPVVVERVSICAFSPIYGERWFCAGHDFG